MVTFFILGLLPLLVFFREKIKVRKCEVTICISLTMCAFSLRRHVNILVRLLFVLLEKMQASNLGFKQSDAHHHLKLGFAYVSQKRQRNVDFKMKILASVTFESITANISWLHVFSFPLRG